MLHAYFPAVFPIVFAAVFPAVFPAVNCAFSGHLEQKKSYFFPKGPLGELIVVAFIAVTIKFQGYLSFLKVGGAPPQILVIFESGGEIPPKARNAFVEATNWAKERQRHEFSEVDLGDPGAQPLEFF